MNCILEDGDGEVTEMAVELGQRSAGFLRDALSALREKDEEIARLHTRMNMLFGYISTLPPWTNKHPEEVKRELLARIEVQA